MVFGEPLDLLNLENLALNLTLEELKNMFFQTLHGLNKLLYEDNPELFLEDVRLMERIRYYAMEKFADPLYTLTKNRIHAISRLNFRVNMSKRMQSCFSNS